MKTISKKLRLYFPFFKAGIKTQLAYKAQIVMWIIISFVDVFFIVFLYQAIYRNAEGGLNSVINGFSFYEMVLYMITSFFFSFIMGADDTSYEIYTDIKEGTIANTLTKPVSYRLRQMFGFLGSMSIQYVLITLPFLTITYAIFIVLGVLKVSLVSFIAHAISFIVFCILACFINNAVSYFIGLMVFYTDHLFGLNMARGALQSFLGGQTVPLSYMGFMGVIFSFTPFAFMNSVPVLTLMCKLDYTEILLYLGVAVGWIVVIETINHLIFKHAITKLTVQGG